MESRRKGSNSIASRIKIRRAIYPTFANCRESSPNTLPNFAISHSFHYFQRHSSIRNRKVNWDSNRKTTRGDPCWQIRQRDFKNSTRFRICCLVVSLWDLYGWYTIWAPGKCFEACSKCSWFLFVFIQQSRSVVRTVCTIVYLIEDVSRVQPTYTTSMMVGKTPVHIMYTLTWTRRWQCYTAITIHLTTPEFQLLLEVSLLRP